MAQVERTYEEYVKALNNTIGTEKIVVVAKNNKHYPVLRFEEFKSGKTSRPKAIYFNGEQLIKMNVHNGSNKYTIDIVDRNDLLNEAMVTAIIRYYNWHHAVKELKKHGLLKLK